MDIERLFKGIAVIIDDEIKDEDSSICKIKGLIEAKNIPVATYRDIPPLDVIPSLANASFIVLDWDYKGKQLSIEGDERILTPDALFDAEQQRLIDFIRELLNKVFVPVFLFTAKPIDEIKSKLAEASLWYDNKPNRIFIKHKNEVDSDVELFSAISDWLKDMPSVYVLREWANTVCQAQSAMFNELYGYSPNWAKIIWDMLKEDSRDNQREFGDFITKQLINRIVDYSFNENDINLTANISTSELIRVVEGERFVNYSTIPSCANTGDLFYDSNSETYYLNVRAQCDLARCRNPKLYLIKGKVLSDKDIITEAIRFTNDGVLHVRKNEYTLDQLVEICNNNDELMGINDVFAAYKNDAFFNSGSIIGKKNEIYITCVGGNKAIKFNLNIEKISKFNEMKEFIIGRILPPYITQIQQNCASYIVREGIMPTPKQVFETYNT